MPWRDVEQGRLSVVPWRDTPPSLVKNGSLTHQFINIYRQTQEATRDAKVGRGAYMVPSTMHHDTANRLPLEAKL